MKLSFIITFHSARLDNLMQNLRFLERYHEPIIKESELILICQDHTNSIATSFAKTNQINMDIECMMLPLLTNRGVASAGSDKIVVLESDRILPTGYFETVFNQLKTGVQITTKNMLKLTKSATDDEIMNSSFSFKEEHRSEHNECGMRNMWSGNTAFMKSDFIECGGMDESYTGYGWADSDMTLKMEASGVQSIFRPEIELHLWHPPLTYGSGDQKQMFIDNGLRFCKKWQKPIPQWLRQEIAAKLWI